jgi:fructuronate reductase
MALTAAGTRLSRASLPGMPAAARPLVEPGAAAPGIVHIGLGAFHRAHQAVYTEDAIARAGGDWGIIAVAPRSLGTVQVLREQDHLFSVASRSGDGDEVRANGALVGVRHLPTEGPAVLDLLADPRIRVVTLTVTEKAYHVGPGSVVRLLADALGRRGGAPIALVSCDNLPDNGARLRGLLERALDRPLDAGVTCPATMVDRIVPATTDATLLRARSALGVDDLAAVEAEPYSQWVIQDAFAAGRPDWAAVFTDDVTAWERLKLRVLNGLHSTTAYLGALAGCRTIAGTLALPGLDELLTRLVAEEIAPTLVPPDGVDVVGYGRQVLERFGNPAIQHRTLQVAMDGTQKLPQRLLSTIVERRRLGGPPGLGALAVAAWMRFAGGVADDGAALPLDDPLADAVRAALPPTGDPAATVRALLALEAVFPAQLRDDAEMVAAVTGWLRSLASAGAAATIRTAVGP